MLPLYAKVVLTLWLAVLWLACYSHRLIFSRKLCWQFRCGFCLKSVCYLAALSKKNAKKKKLKNPIRITDRRLQHLNTVNKASAGQTLRAGLLGGLQGHATLLSINEDAAELQVDLANPPPAKLPITLLLALPRPKMLRRTLQTIASMGVAKLVLINSYRVEKSFWQTPFLQPEALHEQLILGLEQARDTVLPEIILAKRFKPFVEDELPAMAAMNPSLWR